MNVSSALLFAVELTTDSKIQIVGIIALPSLFVLWRWFNKRDERLIAKGRKQADEEAFKKTTQQQTRTFLRWSKKQFKKLEGTLAKLDTKVADHITVDADTFAEIKETSRNNFEELKKLIKTNGNGHDK